MKAKISIVINTYNEEVNLTRALKSVKWADEIIIVDMHSTDKTIDLAKKAKAKVFYHPYTRFVEPARNFAIAKASGDWILVLDADEEIPPTLSRELMRIANSETPISFIEIARVNMIFGKWMQASNWWPDYNIRFFKTGAVVWDSAIHSKPKTLGVGMELPPDAHLSITHYNYSSVSHFVSRMERYSDIQAEELWKKDIKFNYLDLINKPLEEFLSRFFAGKGYEDGVHGLALSLLQAFSFLLVYLKLWEKGKFRKNEIDLKKIRQVTRESQEDLSYWFKFSTLSKNPIKRLFQRAKNKLI